MSIAAETPARSVTKVAAIDRAPEKSVRLPGRCQQLAALGGSQCAGRGALFMMTFFQPKGFTDPFFDTQIALVDRELDTLKSILEGSAR